MAHQSATSGRMVVAAQRREEAVRLRVAGYSYQAIAEAIGFSDVAARKCVVVALDKLNSTCTETTTRMRTLETERLTGIIRDADAILRDPASSNSDRLRALELKVKASESLRKLWGLDAPTKVENEGELSIRVVYDDYAEPTKAAPNANASNT